MLLLITGSTGFLGKHTVAEAVRRGHTVRALIRPGSDPARLGWDEHDRIEIVRGDLRQRRGLDEIVRGVDAVLHLAAAKEGGFYDQFTGTVLATEHLLDAMGQEGIDRMVLTSTFSVYDYTAMRSRATLTDESPLEDDPHSRDDYCKTKLLQERLVRQAVQQAWLRATILRPGVVFGDRDNLWTARLGFRAGGKVVRTGANARLPLVYVENAAEAVVLAAERDAAVGQTLNVIDDERPTQRQYLKMLTRRSGSPVYGATVMPVAWTVMRGLAGMASLTNRIAFGGRAKVPSIFRSAALHARCKPLKYDNTRVKEVLGWQPRYTLEQALERSLSETPAWRRMAPHEGGPRG